MKAVVAYSAKYFCHTAWHTDTFDHSVDEEAAKTITELLSPGPSEPESEELLLENAWERVRQTGPAAELLRQVYVQRIESQMPSLYAHGSLPDLAILGNAFEYLAKESKAVDVQSLPSRATLVEAILQSLGIDADLVLTLKLHRMLSRKPSGA